MADLRSRFIEDYAGGLLNVSRQEFSTSGEVASQDGLPTDGKTLFVEDGTGTKSGLKLGASLAEVVDPLTDEGCVNVRFANRTYAKLRDLKLFTTAIASAQAALSEASATSITNLETTLQLLETDINSLQQSIQVDIYDTRNKIEDTLTSLNELTLQVKQIESNLDTSSGDIRDLQEALGNLNTSFQSYKQSTTTSLSTVSSSLTAAVSRISTLETEVVALKEYRSASQANIISLGTSIESLENRVSALESA